MRQDIVTVLKNSNQAFVRELVGIDPVAVFRWAIVRAYFRGVQAFKAAGQMYKESSTSKRQAFFSTEVIDFLIQAGLERMFISQEISG